MINLITTNSISKIQKINKNSVDNQNCQVISAHSTSISSDFLLLLWQIKLFNKFIKTRITMKFIKPGFHSYPGSPRMMGLIIDPFKSFVNFPQCRIHNNPAVGIIRIDRLGFNLLQDLFSFFTMVGSCVCKTQGPKPFRIKFSKFLMGIYSFLNPAHCSV